MANFIVFWAPVVGSIVVTVATIITIIKVAFEAKNLRRRDVKELLDLIQEAGNRFEKESAKVWLDPKAKPPNGSFEDSLFKDQLVSQIFGREITWYDWLEIRVFMMDHANVSLSLLRSAWPYRDSKRAPHIGFRMTWRIRLSVLGFESIALPTLAFFLLGFMLMQISLAPDIVKWLISLSPQLLKLLSSFGIYPNDQLLVSGLGIMSVTLVILILNSIFNYYGCAARLICKKTERERQPGTVESRRGIKARVPEAKQVPAGVKCRAPE